MNNIDEGIINATMFEDGRQYLGWGSVELPNFQNKSFTMSGGGIAGDIEVPVVGHRDAMIMKINFRDTSEAAYILAEERVHIIEIRVAHQTLGAESSELGESSHKYVAELIPKSLNGGTIAPASTQAVSGEYSCLSIKEYINGELQRDIDPRRFRDVDHTGKDRLANVRSILGLQ